VTALTHEQMLARNALIAECYERNPGRGYLAAVREGARRYREGGRPGQDAGNTAAIAPAVIAEAVVAALARQDVTRKARRARREARERAAADRALVKRMVAERLTLAQVFSETAVGPALREASNADLAVITTTALSGAGQGAPAPRPVAQLTVNPQALDLQEMGIAAVAGMSGSSPFWGGDGGPARGRSPFWRGPQGTGASKGTADADQ
jgi:hypothetical protein